MRGLRRILGTAVASAALAACGASAGHVAIAIDLPTVAALDPSQDPRLALLQLTVTEPGRPAAIESVPLAPGGPTTLDLPAIVPSANALFLLEGLSASGQVLAAGRSPSVNVTLGQELSLTIPLRKPYLFVGGGGSLALYDTVAAADQSCSALPCFALGSPGVASPLDVLPVPDGSLLLSEVAGSPSALVALATGADKPLPATAALPHGSPGLLGASSDGRWALVPFPVDGDVALVDLATLRSGGELAVRDISVPGAPDAVWSDGTTGWALLGRPQLPPLACSGAVSSIQTFDLASAATSGPAHVLTSGATALALAGGSTGYLAEPCAGELARVDLSTPGSSDSLWMTLPGLQPIALVGTGATLWTAGVTSGPGAAAEIDAIDVASRRLTRVAVPVPDERVLFGGAMSATTTDELSVKDGIVEIYDLGVSPGGQQAAALAHIVFQSRGLTVVGAFGCTISVDDFDADTYYYLLLDLGTGGILQRVRFSCTIDDRVDPSNPWGFTCSDQEDSGEQILTGSDQFIPAGAALLGGAN